MSQGYPLTKLFAYTTEKDSPLHGKGIFATSPITIGEYSILPTDPHIRELMEKAGFCNSSLMPDWKDLLPHVLRRGSSDDDDDDAARVDEVDFMEQLKIFREGFDAYMMEEQSKANVRNHTFKPRGCCFASSEGIDFVVEVLRNIDEDEELLRAYGKEWLSIKYFAVKSALLHYMEAIHEEDDDDDDEEEEKRKKLVFAVDTKLLDCSMYKFNSTDDTNDKLGRYLSHKEGKDMVVLSPEELNSLANIIGMLAIEYLSAGDDDNDDLELTWKHNIEHLQSHFRREVIHPASFSSYSANKKKSSKKKRKTGNGAQIEKLKHGEFDVYKMKKM